MIGRADIEGSKSDVAMNAWPPQASYPCGNFSGTSSLKFRGSKGSIGHTFMVCIHTENQNQGDFYPFVLLEISVLHEPPLGHLRYGLTDVPPQPNSPPDNVFNPGRPAKDLKTRRWTKIQPRFIEYVKNNRSCPISPAPNLPPILHPLCLFTMSTARQAQQGLLSPLILPTPFPW